MYRIPKTSSQIVSTTSTPSASHGSSVGIEEFVRQVYFEGIPYEEGSKFTSADVPTLLKMLKNPPDEPYLTNVVVVLGMIGDPAAVDPLITLLEHGESRTVEEYRARKSVLPALGYIVKRSGDQEALAYLKDSLSPGIWARRGVTLVRPGLPADAPMMPEKQRDLKLYKQAIIGLALAGHPDAETRLRALKTGQLAISPELETQLKAITDEALKASQTIRHEGLKNYYKKERQRLEAEQPTR